MYHLTYLRDEVIQLMKKFTTLPKDVAEEKEIDCCGVMYHDKDAFKQHYEAAHNKKVLQSASMCEVKLLLTHTHLLFDRCCINSILCFLSFLSIAENVSDKNFILRATPARLHTGRFRFEL
uniref:uncharacterized protein LOC125906588 n=1 Tax=Anopheles coluzzii TaxID=1518534 RepID=UPI0020FFF051|nr:uncharacterized protein LOC125906588 [Anopheles coluzzii]